MAANRQPASNSIATTDVDALHMAIDSLADRLKSLSLDAKDTGEAVPGEAEAGEAVPGEAVPGEAVLDEAVGSAIDGSAVDGSVVDVEAGVKDV